MIVVLLSKFGPRISREAGRGGNGKYRGEWVKI